MVAILELLKDVAKIYFEVALLLQVKAYRENPIPLRLSFLDYLTYPMLKEIYAPFEWDCYIDYKRLLEKPDFVRETYSRKIDCNLDVWREICDDGVCRNFPFQKYKIIWYRYKVSVIFKMAVGEKHWVLVYKKIMPL